MLPSLRPSESAEDKKKFVTSTKVTMPILQVPTEIRLIMPSPIFMMRSDLTAVVSTGVKEEIGRISLVDSETTGDESVMRLGCSDRQTVRQTDRQTAKKNSHAKSRAIAPSYIVLIVDLYLKIARCDLEEKKLVSCNVMMYSTV